MSQEKWKDDTRQRKCRKDPKKRQILTSPTATTVDPLSHPTQLKATLLLCSTPAASATTASSTEVSSTLRSTTPLAPVHLLGATVRSAWASLGFVLLRFDKNSMRLAANFDPYTPFAPLLLSERGNDRFSSGIYRLEFQESTGFVAENFEVFDKAKPQKRLLKESL